MKKFFAPALMVLMAVPLAACGGDGDDALAEKTEDKGEADAAGAEAMGANAATVDAIEDNAEDRADAIDDSDVDTDDLTDAQKGAMVNGN